MSSRDDLYGPIENAVLREFPDVVVGTEPVEGKLRLFVKDGSFIDVWLSQIDRLFRGWVIR